MRKVLIGTPAYDGRVDVWFANALVNTVRMSYEKETIVVPVYMAYDSLVQRARNDLVRLALEEDFDDLIFIDSDVEWNPEWVFKLLEYSEPVVGGVYPKKTDEPQFPVHALKDGMKLEENGLIEVDGLPTGFLKISKDALKKVWDASTEYTNEGRNCRMVFDIQVQDGQLVSEDIVFCRKWHDLGGKVFVDPTMTCNHVGTKKYSGNFMEYIKAIGAL
jgi:glycosyltransferase involved in cell wall biosynthesis